MKANRKFLAERDDAVSPVIAVILMVAITVVLAATVYVWVSGFGAQGSTPAKTLSMTSSGAISSVSDPDGAGTGTAYQVKSYTVSSATPGLRWSDLSFTLDGATMDYVDDDSDFNTDTDAATPGTLVWATAGPAYCVASSGTDCDASAPTTVSAGQQVKIAYTSVQSSTLRILDSQANSVVLTLTVG